MRTLAKLYCEIWATLTILIGSKRIVGDYKWKYSLKQMCCRDELASCGVLILGGADIFQQQSLKSVDAARPSASTTSTSRAQQPWRVVLMWPIRVASELASPARLPNDVDLLFHAATLCSFVFWSAIQEEKASRTSCFVHKQRFAELSWLICRVRCYQALSASCKTSGVDNRSAGIIFNNLFYSFWKPFSQV